MRQDQYTELAALVLHELPPHVRHLVDRAGMAKRPDRRAEAHTLLLLIQAVQSLGVPVHHGNRGAIVAALEAGRMDAVRVIVSAPALEVES